MRYFSLLFLLLLAPILSGAQSIANKAEIGVTIGDNLSTYSGRSDAKMTQHLTLGVYSKIKLSNKISVAPKVYFKYGTGAKGLTLQMPNITFSAVPNVTRSVSYISIAAPFSYHFNTHISAGLGPQFMIQNGARDQFDSGAGYDYSVNQKDAIHKFDAGAVANFSLSIGKNNLFNVGASYYYGIMYIFKDDSSLVRNSVFQIEVGIPVVKW